MDGCYYVCVCLIIQLEALSRRLGTFVEVDEDDSWCDAVGQLTVDPGSLLKDYQTALDELKYDGAELVVGCVCACVRVCVCECLASSKAARLVLLMLKTKLRPCWYSILLRRHTRMLQSL